MLTVPQNNTRSFNCHSHVRLVVTSFPDTEPEADASWQCTLTPSAMEFCEFIENLVYNTTYDCRYRDAIKSKLEVEDFLAYPSIKPEMDKIADLIRTELQPEPAPQPGQSGDTGNGSSPPNGEHTGDGGAGSSEAPAQSSHAASATGWDSLSAGDQAHWDRFILRQISLYAKIIDDKATRELLVDAIREVGLNDIVGDMMGLVLYYFDSKNFGESLQRPDLRYPPLREKDYFRLVKAVLEARHPVSATAGGTSNLGVGEVAVLLDGSKKGNMTKLLSPWKDGTRGSNDT